MLNFNPNYSYSIPFQTKNRATHCALPSLLRQKKRMTSWLPYYLSKKKRQISNLKVLFTNPNDFVTSSNFHASYIDEDDYQPSAELLAALNTLPPELLDVKMEAEEEELKPQVKSEPIEHEIGGT